jgi:hypothetical protein
MKVEVDSISPTGGLLTGETRVLVRGGIHNEKTGMRRGDFRDLELIYPKPMCKFGRNSQIVKAQYVGCTFAPLSFAEIEGKHAKRVSNPLF